MKVLALVVLLAVAACAFADAKSNGKLESAPKHEELVTGELRRGKGPGFEIPISPTHPGAGMGCSTYQTIECKLKCGGTCANGQCSC